MQEIKATPSPRQEEILRWVSAFIGRKSRPPTRGEIARKFKVTKPSVQWHLKELEKRGYIRRVGRAKEIQVIKEV